MDGGSSISPTFKPKHISFHSIISWGIEMMVFLGNKKVLVCCPLIG